jgi:putative ABC transport system permease protein
VSAFAGLFGGGAGGETFQLPEGVELPEGFTPPTDGSFPFPQGGAGSSDSADSAGSSLEAPSGFAMPEGFEMPQAEISASGSSEAATNTAQGSGFPGGAGFPGGGGGFPTPSVTASFLVPIAAMIALVGAVGSGVRPRFNRLATGITLLLGLVSVGVFVAFFIQDALIPINLINLATPGFWIALVASLGLIVQVLIPRAAESAPDDVNVTQLVKTRRRSGLSLQQNIAVSLDALMANKLRSGLTMLGIVIGVTSVVALVSVGRGAQTSVTEQISGTGLNLLTISPGGGGGFGGPGGGGGGGGTRTDTLIYDDAEAIEDRIGGLTAVLPQYSGTLQVRTDISTYNATVLGSTEQYAEARSIEVEIGRFFSQEEYRSSSRVVVLGMTAAEELFSELNPIGRDVRIDGTRFEVVGVLEQQDGGFGNDPNLQLYVPLSTAYRNLFDARATGSSKNTVSSIIVAVEDIEQVDAITEDITALLRERHRLDEDEEDDFNILDQQQLLDVASSITGILTVLLGAIASISLVVGGIGIMNIMLVSVTERTKEIGLRKAVGARKGHILQQFLIETIVLSVLGGTLGVLLGVGIALLVNASGLISATVSMDSIALGLGSSIIIGVFFGVYPANQAASLEPIEALRYE